jgi:hypothetical protein
MADQVPAASINTFLFECLEIFPAACGMLSKIGDPESLKVRTKLFELMGAASNLSKWSEAACGQPSKTDGPSGDPSPSSQRSKLKTKVMQESNDRHATYNHSGSRNGRCIIDIIIPNSRC